MTHLSGLDRQFAATEPLEVLLQQPLRVVLSDLLASHFSDLRFIKSKIKTKTSFKIQKSKPFGSFSLLDKRERKRNNQIRVLIQNQKQNTEKRSEENGNGSSRNANHLVDRERESEEEGGLERERGRWIEQTTPQPKTLNY